MAETKVPVENVETNAAVERAKGFWAKFSRPIMYIGGAIIVLACAWFGYKYLYKLPNEAKANDIVFPAEKLFDKMAQVSSFPKDTVGIVLNGGMVDGEKVNGLLTFINNYGGTAAGNRAQYITGACYLHLGEFDKAVKYLKEFDGNGATQISSAAYRMLGDAYGELKKNSEALAAYKKAIDAAADKDDITKFLATSRAALFCEATGNTKEAITLFQQLKDEFGRDFYRNNRISFDPDKYLAKLGVTP
ncbi:tetratricopeptide repeat protein [Ferruginibacter sp.]